MTRRARPRLGRLTPVLLVLLLVAVGCGGEASQASAKELAQADAALANAKRGEPLLRYQQGEVMEWGPMDVREVSFDALDRQRIPALYAVPRGVTTAKECVIFQPGLGANRDAAASVYDGFAGLGIPVMTIDVRGKTRGGKLDLSDGKNVNPKQLATDMRNTVLDLRRALDVLTLEPQCRNRPIGYVGVSLGGFLGTVLAGVDKRVDALVAMVTGAGWHDILYAGGGNLWSFKNRDAAVRALTPYDPGRWIARVSPRPVLLVNGIADPIVPFKTAQRLQHAAKAPKQIYNYEGGHDPIFSDAGPGVASRVSAFLTEKLAG